MKTASFISYILTKKVFFGLLAQNIKINFLVKNIISKIHHQGKIKENQIQLLEEYTILMT